MSPAATSSVRKDETIQLRASAETKALLNRAANLRGQKLSEFLLDSARREAEATLLDQRLFLLDEAAHAAFLKQLDAPQPMNDDARRRLTGKPLWQE